MKVCSRCKKKKSIEKFNKKGERRRQPYCRDCQKKWQRAWYAKPENAEAERQRARVKRRKGRKAIKALVERIKNVPCRDCKQRFPSVAMDFDHVRGRKRCEVGRMASQGFSLASVKKEIEKCEVVCACCHRVRTAKEWGVV